MVSFYHKWNSILNWDNTPREATQESVESSITFRHVKPMHDRRECSTASMEGVFDEFVKGGLPNTPECCVTKNGSTHGLSVGGRLVAIRCPAIRNGFSIIINPDAPDDMIRQIKEAALKNGMK